MGKMKLIVTIDAEEDNWGDSSSRNYTVDNIARIPVLQQLFDDFDIKPTYLITYPVATAEKAIAILQEILEAGKCEIGAQCHPWNTPPLEEEKTKRNSMLCNLPVQLQYKKMRMLHETIQKYYDIAPISFRSGRWGYSQDVARNLYKLGYKIDSSLTPYTDWRTSQGPDFSNISPRLYRFSVSNTCQPSTSGELVEMPVTIGYTGYLGANFAVSNAILKVARRKRLNHLKLTGILHRFNIIRKVWLSPEVSDLQSMIDLTQQMLKHNYSCLNMVFHSPSLQYGLTPFVQTKDDEERFLDRIKAFLSFIRQVGIEPIKLSDITNFI
jgi:hypothetical protein